MLITPSEEKLVSDARNGDMKAFKGLVDQYQGKVAGVIKAMLGDTPEAIDAGQEVFIRFYEALDKYKGEAALGTYLIRIAINLSLNELRKRKKRNDVFWSEEAGLDVSADTKEDLRQAVRYEIDRLEPEFKLVVILRMMEDYSTEETAELLNIPLGTVLSRLFRAQKKLKLALAKYLE